MATLRLRKNSISVNVTVRERRPLRLEVKTGYIERQEAGGLQLYVGDLGFLRIFLAPCHEEAPHAHSQSALCKHGYMRQWEEDGGALMHIKSCVFCFSFFSFLLFCHCISLWVWLLPVFSHVS